MKKLQQVFALLALTLMFSVSTFAGDGIITTWPKAEPSPTPALVIATNNETQAEGIITTWPKSNDSVTEVALSMLQSVLALF